MADASGKAGEKLTKIGAYNVGKTIGKGNFAVVKLAEHCTAKEKVAIKMIDKIALNEANLQKTMREIKLMKLINHSNIIRLYEVMETERYLYLVIEYAEKGEIFDLLIKNGRLHEREARKMFRQIIAAVECLHQKRIVHRDLKAENLLLDINSRIKLADFGFSNTFAVGAKLKTWCGSPPYAAPELFEGKEYYGPAADIWSMGVVLYVLVCGALPFDGRTLPDLKQRVLAGKFRIPFFMSSDCESLIRHMLVVDLNKRYTMNQIKQHKWIIQGEPYEFLEEEDEFNFAQQHCNGSENGNILQNESIIEQMENMGEDKAQIIESIQKKKFDQLYGLYHILLDKHLKELRILSLQNRSDYSQIECVISSDNVLQHEVEQEDKTNFLSVEPQHENVDFEEGDPNPAELAKYFASRRRETIAVSHVKPDVNSAGFFSHVEQGDRIPEINLCLSPSPPPLNDTSQLQYKEQYLPRPVVLQVRPEFDRRASDGSATLQESILQFNMMRNNLSKKRNSNPFAFEGDSDSSNNLLNVPLDDNNTGSESDNDVDQDALDRYMRGRGKKQRHTITSGSTNRSNLAPTYEEYEEDIGSLKKFHQQFTSKQLRPNKLPNRERERASPVPYLPITPEARRLVTERRQSDGLFIDKKKDESTVLIDIYAEHKRLQDQYGSSQCTEPQPRPNQAIRRNLPNHTRGDPKRNSYPSGQIETPVMEPELPSPSDISLEILRQKQEKERENMFVQFLVKKKFLEKQLEAERKEFIRRASEGAPALEKGVSEFLARQEAAKNIPKNLSSNDLAHGASIVPATDLQDEMKKLNLQVSSGLPATTIANEPLHYAETLFNGNLQGSPSSDLSPFPISNTHIMDIDDQPPIGAMQPSFQYANINSLYNSPNINNNNRSRRSHLLHSMSPSMGVPQRTFIPDDSNQGMLGERIWGSPADSTGGKPIANTHQLLTGTLSVDVTTSLDISEVISQIKAYLDSRLDLDYNQSDSCFSLYKEGIQMEIEVYSLSKNGVLNGVKVHRVGGDIWAYKKLRDEIYASLYLD